MQQPLIKSLVGVLTAILGLGFFNVSYADHHSRGGWGWGFTTGLVGGAVIGSQWGRPYYYPYAPFSPYPPTVVYQQPQIVQVPPEYVQSPTPPVTSVQTSPPVIKNQPIWYLCESANNFYPNVSSCPEPWKVINANSSSTYSSASPSPSGTLPQ